LRGLFLKRLLVEIPTEYVWLMAWVLATMAWILSDYWWIQERRQWGENAARYQQELQSLRQQLQSKQPPVSSDATPGHVPMPPDVGLPLPPQPALHDPGVFEPTKLSLLGVSRYWEQNNWTEKSTRHQANPRILPSISQGQSYAKQPNDQELSHAGPVTQNNRDFPIN
jgi:hypothetical protein